MNKIKKLISVLLAIIFVSSYSISQVRQKEIIEEADLLLDMMEYESAINNYLKIISLDSPQKDIRKKIGYAFFQMGKADETFKYLKEELTLFPDNVDAYDLLVYVLYKLDKLHDAKNYLERYNFQIRLDEENPHIGGLGAFIIGMHLKEIKEYGLAKKYFKKAIEKGHDKVKCYVQLIDIDLVRGKLESKFPGLKLEIEIFTEAFQACGRQPEFYFMYGLSYLEKAKMNAQFLRRAIGYFEYAFELNPYFKDALFNLACISYNYNDFEKASKYFKEVLKMEPENDEIAFYLSCCFKMLDKSIEDESLSECPKKINLSKEFIDRPDREYKFQSEYSSSFVAENINYLALEFIRRGKFPEAMRRLRNGLKIYFESPEINFNLGMVYSWQNSLKKAEEHALIALRKRGFFGRVPNYRIQEIIKKEGKSLYKPLDTPLSEWTFEVALEMGNHFLDAYDFLGNIYFKREDYDKSLLAFKKVIEIYPKDAMGHYNLGCVYKALDDGKNAEQEWREAIKYEEELKRIRKRAEISDDQLDVSLVVLYRPVSYQAYKSLGSLYLEHNLQDEALKEFEKALELEPDDPELYYEIGKIYHAKSVLDEKCVRKAIFYYEKYLYLGGEKEIEVRELLKSLKKELNICVSSKCKYPRKTYLDPEYH